MSQRGSWLVGAGLLLGLAGFAGGCRTMVPVGWGMPIVSWLGPDRASSLVGRNPGEDWLPVSGALHTRADFADSLETLLGSVDVGLDPFNHRVLWVYVDATLVEASIGPDRALEAMWATDALPFAT